MSALSTEVVGCSQFESHPEQCKQHSKASRDFDWDLLAANRFCRASCQISLEKEQFKDTLAQSSCCRSLHCFCVVKILEGPEAWTWNKMAKLISKQATTARSWFQQILLAVCFKGGGW